MSTLNPDEINPFQAPRSDIGAPPVEASADAEAIRRMYIGHEASVKSIGVLAYLGMAGLILVAAGIIFAGFAAPQNVEGGQQLNIAAAVGMGVVFLGFAGLYGAMGYGLRRLKTWARWVTLVLMALLVFYNVVQAVLTLLVVPFAAPFVLIGSLIPGYILYLVASAKGAMVFSPAYREVIRQTPHVKYKTSLLVKILLGFLLAIIVLVILVAIFGVSGR